MFAVGDRVRVRAGKDVIPKCWKRGMVDVLAKSIMGKSGKIVETSEHHAVARIEFEDAASHLSRFYVPHNVMEKL